MGAEVGGGGGANINVIPKSRRQHAARASAHYSITGKGYWDNFTGNNITDELRAQGITDPTLRNLNDFNANAGGPFIKDRLWWFGSFRNYNTVEATPAYTVVNADGSLTNPFDSQPAQLHRERQVPGQQEQPAVGVLDLQPEVPAAPRRRRRAAESD